MKGESYNWTARLCPALSVTLKGATVDKQQAVKT